MLTDEQLIERIRSGLRAELSQLHPPSDLLDRVHQPASTRRPWPRRSSALRGTGHHRRRPSVGVALTTVAAGLAVVLGVLALVALGHGRSATHPTSSLKNSHPQLSAALADCMAHGGLTRTYSRAQITRALAEMSTAERKYTNCPVVLRAALHIASTKPRPGAAAALSAESVRTLLAGIPQSGTQLGNPRAAVTAVVFADLECPICRAFTLGEDSGGFPQLVRHDVRDGTVKIEYRSFCTATCNAVGRVRGEHLFDVQQSAAYAAGQQNLFWDYALLFYKQQGQEDTPYVTPHYLTALAKQTLGLNLERWQTNRDDPGLVARVNADERAANSQRLTGTPTVIMYGPKGKKQLAGGVPKYVELQQAIKDVR
jgi:protein-disulfide isomerase